MLPEILVRYLSELEASSLAPATRKAIRADLQQFVNWWERHMNQPFDLTLVTDSDLRMWQRSRQIDDGAKPRTINRALVSLRRFCAWAQAQNILGVDPTVALVDLSISPPPLRRLSDIAVNALLRAAQAEPNMRVRVRDEALLALLIYAGLRTQEVCSLQIRDLDLANAALTVRNSKGRVVRRVTLEAEALPLLQRYLSDVRCSPNLAVSVSASDCEPLYVVHTIAPLCDSSRPTLAKRFVDYVCSPTGQAVLESYRFLPVYTQPTIDPILPVFRPDEIEFSPNETLTVYTAATLMEAFRDLAHTFSELQGGITIDLVVAGSQYLAEQLLAGAAADVFASANPQPLQVVCQAGRIRAGSEQPFARNRLIAVTSETCSVRLNTLRDLAQPGIKIALGSQAAAIGHYTQAMLTQATQGGYLATAEHDAVLHNVSFYEQDVRLVLSRVLCGEADVGIVYTSDYHGVADAIKTSQVYPLDELWLNTG